MPSHSFQRFLSLLAMICCAALPRTAEAQRLPATVVPENYRLLVDVNIAGRKFSGEETIRVRIAQPVREVVLNSLGLDILSAELIAGGSTQTVKVSYDRAAETAHLTLERPAPPGEADLHIKFSGPLTEGLRGLYLSRTPGRFYAVTQFEGTYARMMFPSFDEPAYKATFDLSVIADKGDTAISNGRIIRNESMGTRHKITFSTSPRMSTYLLALAVGDWQCREGKAEDIPVRVCATPDKKDKTAFALEVAVHSLEFYNRWYGIKYPFSKLDMVAIPDYEWGGMENTASIFYRDTALLLDEDRASEFARRGHATVIAHEIAHQWFGDLVTAAWWDDIWLNEGFASWMERKPIEAWHPEWRMEEDATASAQAIIGLDSLASARAIHGNPRTSSEIKEMFDGITYEKGAAVLRMLEAYLGPEVFRRGVNQYLKEHANGNATSADFWKAMTQVSGKPVDKIMPGFVMQPGAPVVSVDGACQADVLQLQLEQQRFYVSLPSGAQPGKEQWQVPVCLKSPGACTVLSGKTQTLPVESCPPWVFANREAKGYYRVAYQPGMLEKIGNAAEKELTASERIALVEDAWAMTRAGRYAIGTFMDLAQNLKAEHDRLVVNFLAAHLESASQLVSEKNSDKYQEFVRRQFAPLAREIGWEARPDDSDERKTMRASLMQILGGAGDPQAIAAARKIVQQYLNEPASTDPTLTGPAFSVAAANGDSALYEKLSSALAKAKATDEYYLYLYSLAGFQEPPLVQRTLALVDRGKLRQQDYPGFFSALLGNSAARDAAWAYLKAHWDGLAEKVTSFGGRGAVSALGNFCSDAERDDVRQFFAGHRAPGAERAVQQSLERISGCMEFKQLQQGNMEKWLAAEKR